MKLFVTGMDIPIRFQHLGGQWVARPLLPGRDIPIDLRLSWGDWRGVAVESPVMGRWMRVDHQIGAERLVTPTGVFFFGKYLREQQAGEEEKEEKCHI